MQSLLVCALLLLLHAACVVALSFSACSGRLLRMTSTINPATSNKFNTKYPLQNDLMLRTALGQKVEKTPVWVFRQAGRHLPEYNDYKKMKNKSFIELLDDPVDVAECTMQPIRRYNLDAAILFSDILVILQALGVEVTMPGGVGITVPQPLRSPSEVDTRLPQKAINTKEKLGHVIKAVELIKEELKGKVPLIGFSAAPWTLMYYMVGGSSKKNQQVGSEWLASHPRESKKLLDLLTSTVIDYVSDQVDAGADMIQIFEAMGDFISEDDFYKWALPCMQQISEEMRRRHPGVPLLVFPRGATYSLAALQQAGYDVVTLDTTTKRAPTRALLAADYVKTTPPLGRVSGVQGNFDVKLLEKGVSTVAQVRTAVEQMLQELGPQGLIANLGEGLLGKEDPVLVAAFVDAVHEVSAKMIKEGQY